jgi:hypothetical protein
MNLKKIFSLIIIILIIASSVMIYGLNYIVSIDYSPEMKIGQTQTIKVTVKDNDNNTLEGKNVFFEACGSKITDNSGVVSFDYTAEKIYEDGTKDFTLTVADPDDSDYEATSESVPFHFSRGDTAIKLDLSKNPIMVDDKVTISATLTNNDSHNIIKIDDDDDEYPTKVFFNIDGVKHEGTHLGNGIFTFEYTPTEAGDHDISANFSGNRFQEAADGNIILNVNEKPIVPDDPMDPIDPGNGTGNNSTILPIVPPDEGILDIIGDDLVWIEHEIVKDLGIIEHEIVKYAEILYNDIVNNPLIDLAVILLIAGLLILFLILKRRKDDNEEEEL